ncbi:MAG: beta-lactamase family protein [Cyclobacteriaceae bacterium]|nr:beta-lactamase family protein [Cyclobacteriaceae bacterium]
MKKLYWSIVTALCFVSCTPKQPDPFQELDLLFSKEFKLSEPGGAMIILKDEQIVFSRATGTTDLSTGEVITTKTLFNTGSISKTFVSNTILLLAEEGKLSLNDSLYKYFPTFKNKSIAQKVKIHHLLTHTSGLPDNRREFLDSVALLTAKDKENFAPILLCDSLLFEPGSRFEYSNPAFNGLALIIEQVTGKKWQDVVVEKIFKPSSMPNSKITDGPYPQEGVAHAYLQINGKYIEKDFGEEPTFAAAGNGGVWSSAEELASYEIAIRKSLFLNPEVLKRSRTTTHYPNWKSEIPAFIGYSWFIEKYDSLQVVAHTGTQGGFYADYVSIPEKKLLYVIVCNRPFPREAFREKVLAYLNSQNWLSPL